MIGTAVAQYAFSIWTTSIGDRPSEKRVKPARSAKSAVDLGLVTTELGERRLDARDGPRARGRRTDGTARPPWPSLARRVRGARPPRIRTRRVGAARAPGRAAPASGPTASAARSRRTSAGRCVRASAPGTGRRRRGDRTLAPVLAADRDGHDPEGDGHQHVPLPPGRRASSARTRRRSGPPRAARRRRRPTSGSVRRRVAEDPQVAPGGERVQGDADRGEERNASGRLLFEGPVEERHARRARRPPKRSAGARERRGSAFGVEGSSPLGAAELDGGRGGEPGGQEQTDRGRDTKPEFGWSSRTSGVASACSARNPELVISASETRNRRASARRCAASLATRASATLISATTGRAGSATDGAPTHVDARDGEEQDEPGERQREQHAEEPDSRAVLHVSSMDRAARARARRGRDAREPSERTTVLRIVGYGSRAPPGDPRRAIERAWPADRLASRLRIEGSPKTRRRDGARKQRRPVGNPRARETFRRARGEGAALRRAGM